ncbi:hypothetical protein EMCG_08201 [[Emmonsia] crescens]|uniref:Release factor glutamine methyltransferase N-terminal domain-containing protein n=1 Tax=[Emmonsia] crescens TaxID=73230 RepID=A0A0G2I716_9EURO|nr:hypothetical protein EMCG_08201 [Emmonsia crescens UAMH 3008]
MPRLPPSLLRRAYSIHPLLPLLLRECRDLPSARNELRWLSEYARAKCQRYNNRGNRPMAQERYDNDNVRLELNLGLRDMARQRARGVPLQYILGDQPFGELEILCRRGVLIPRPETESYTTRIANLLLSKFAPANRKHEYKYKHIPTLRILDLCTGTGCIPLLLHSLLAPSFPRLQICGVDISSRALKLAQENLEHNIKLGRLIQRARGEVSFVRGDVLSELGVGGSMQEEGMERIFAHFTTTCAGGNYTSSAGSTRQTVGTEAETDTHTITILLSNPPYISPAQFTNGTTARSVRKYEPKLALVPPPVVTGTDTAGTAVTDTSTPTSKRQVGEIHETVAAARREDMFYPHILSMGLSRVDAADLVVLECGDKGQAGRVAEMARRVYGGLEVEVWRCDGDGADLGSGKSEDRDSDGDGDNRGARAVVVRRGGFLDR